MTTRQGIDYSFARPGGAAIKAAGKEFVLRYVSGAGKALTPDELADLRANGLAVGLAFESTGERALEGYEAGRVDANTALDAAWRLGFPGDQTIYFAVDFDAQPHDFALIDAYLKGAAYMLGPARVGVYGSFAVVEHCRSAGSARWLWQTYAWSGGAKSTSRHIYQYQNDQRINGAAVDYCEAYGDNVGLWEPEEDDMGITEEQAKAIANAAAAAAIKNYQDNLVSLDIVGVLEQMTGIIPSTFDPENQARVDMVLATLPAAGGHVPPHEHEMGIAIEKTGPVTS